MIPSTDGPMSVCRVGVSEPDAVIGTATSAFATFVTDIAIASTTGAFAFSLLSAGPPQAESNPDFAPIDWVEAEYDSNRGKIKVAWKKTDQGLEYQVTIPANTTATLELPVGEGAVVTESGRPLPEAGIAVDGEGTASLVSGSYYFIVKE